MSIKNKIYFVLEIMPIITILISCSSKSDKIPKIISSSPIYRDNNYVYLEKLYSIDVTQINLFSKQYEYQGCVDFDMNNNLYILDRYEGTITVFDENGKFVNKFGRRGQGPNEFLDANFTVIRKDKIYVFQGFFELKIANLQGEYISKHIIQLIYDNPLKIIAVGDKFYLLKGKTDRTFTKLELILTSLEETFSGGKELFRYKYPLGLSGPPCWEWILILDSGEFYFPEDNLNKYSIIKYDKLGKPRLIFGREYQIEKYSEEAREELYSKHKKSIDMGKTKFPPAPPVLRTMFQDLRENIWVISGETYEDNMNPNYENSVDIFNKKGEWLYFFKSKNISKNCFYKDGKIYKVLPIDPETYAQYIEVYKIKYLNSQ
ncbi:MAG: 6-bladed beta-propeller [Acidobacteriota bacterium]